MASEQGVPVELYIYDLTNGMASLLSPAIIGKFFFTSTVLCEMACSVELLKRNSLLCYVVICLHLILCLLT